MAEVFYIKFKNPFTMFIAGPTKSGKTTFVEHLIANASKYYSKKPNKIFYFYNMNEPVHPNLRRTVDQFIEGTPTKQWLNRVCEDFGTNLTIVIDDQALNLNDSISELFTVGSSRKDVNIIFLTQNLFLPAKQARTISLNCNYFVIFKNPRDVQAPKTFFRQLEGDSQVIYEIYKDATALPHSYLLIALHQETLSENRFMSNVFGEDGTPPVLYRM